MDAVQIHTRAINGHVSFDLPAEYAALANAHLLVLLVPEPVASAPVGRTDWDALHRAFEGHDPYPTITDAVTWQRQLRATDEREFDR